MIAKQHNLPVIIVLFPVIFNMENYQWTDIHKQVSNAALRLDFKVLDLLPEYQKYKQSDLQVDNGDHIHPNKIGHKIASDALYSFLQNNELLP